MNLNDLNPQSSRDKAARLKAINNPSAFAATAAATVAEFANVAAFTRGEVQSGRLGVVAAREKLGALARGKADELAAAAGRHQTLPGWLKDNLRAARDKQQAASRNRSTDDLLRELIRLQEVNLIEQRVGNRAGAYAAQVRAFEGDNHKAGDPPSVAALAQFTRSALAAGDQAGAEWGKRQLLAARPMSEADASAIGELTYDPTRVDVSRVNGHLEVLARSDDPARKQFAESALASGDANALAAAWIFAATSPAPAPYTSDLASRTADFPPPVLEFVAGWDADARRAETESAMAHVASAAVELQRLAAMEGVKVPTDDELARAARAQADAQRVREQNAKFLAGTTA